ncbi:MAG: ABC transporter permease [bacterium TMED144]|nr:MAG: ABC transporter permease [bacterium TMED144]|tara:strand:- start:7585 stop:8454 length:870 start_codon:yes stop_codon:yes gene_type:complete
MDKFSFLISEGFKNIFRHKLTSFATIFSVFLTLSIVGCLILGNQNTNKIIEYLRAKYKIEVFFKEGFTDDELKNAINQIGSIKGVRSTTLISKKDAEKIFKSQFGEDIFDLVGFNPLPASCVVNVEKDGIEKLEIMPIIKRLEMLPVVDEIKYQSGLISRIESYYERFSQIAILCFILSLAISIFVISNTIRLTIFSRKNLIKSFQLIGATRSFVRFPFIIEGLFHGFFGSMLSSIALYFLIDYSNTIIDDIISFKINFDPYMLSVTLIFIGIMISTIGSIRATSKYIK